MRIHRFLKFIDGNKLTPLDLIAYKSGVPLKRLDELWRWSFGDDYRKARVNELIDRWNNLHAKDMLIMRHHSVVKSIRAISLIFLSKRP